MSPRAWLVIGSLLAGLAVAAGAFGAHGLKGRLEPERLETFEVAVRYQMYHALALVAVGLLLLRGDAPLANWAGLLFLGGVLVFSGLLYLWIFTGVRLFALIVPLGGTALIAGWAVLAAAAWRFNAGNG